MKKIVLITPGQPSSNPRLTKEAIALSDNGYQVSVYYCYWAEWAENQDNALFKEHPNIKWVQVGGSPHASKIRYFYTRFRNAFFRRLVKYFKESSFMMSRAEARCYDELNSAVIKEKADLFIAHHVSVLSIAHDAASHHTALYGYDAEDYYRGMCLDESYVEKYRKKTEDRFVPGAVYVTAASPLIAHKYQQHYLVNVTTILNAFSTKYLNNKLVSKITNPIRLFWFSQTIGLGRGLEDVLMAMAQFPEHSFQLTLLGSARESIKNQLIELLVKNGGNKDDILFMEPLALDQISKLASTQHIGLAIDTPEQINHNICLANKIFFYMLTGNAVLFSKTDAHKLFFSENNDVGFIYESGNILHLTSIMRNWLTEPEKLNSCRYYNLQLATQFYNWELEKEKYLTLLNSVFSGS